MIMLRCKNGDLYGTTEVGQCHRCENADTDSLGVL